MAIYFNFLPKIQYTVTLDDYEDIKTITKMHIRPNILDSIKNLITNYYPYTIGDGERAEVLSYRYYGSVKYVWLIWLINDIIDPYNQWPYSNNDLNKIIADRYGSVQYAQTLVHEYRKLIRSGSTTEKAYSIQVDESTYNTLPIDERSIVTKLDYEFQLNEDKRNINLIEDVYIDEIYKEAQTKYKLG